MNAQLEALCCPYCTKMFVPKREHQTFCGQPCRTGYHLDFGTQGVVAGVTRLQRGRVSVVLHFEAGPAADHAIVFLKGEVIRMVKQPKGAT